MIPLRDVIPSRTTPLVTIGLIVANTLAWFCELSLPPDVLPAFLRSYGVVAADSKYRPSTDWMRPSVKYGSSSSASGVP